MLKVFLINSTITLTTFLSNILVGRLYGKEELGIYSYFFGLTFLAAIFAQFGTQNSIPKLIVKKAEPKQLFKRAFILTTTLAVIFGLFAFWITDLFSLNPKMPYFWLQVLVQVVLLTIFSVYSNALRGFKLFIKSSLFSFYTRILFVALIPIVFFLFGSFQWVLVVLSFSLLVMLPPIFKGISKAAKRFIEKEKVINVSTSLFLKESFILLLFSLSSFLLMHGDRIVIKYFLSFNDVGQYSAYSTLINIIRLGAATFPLILLPLASERKYRVWPVLRKMLVILIPVVIIIVLLSYVFVPIMFGADFVLDKKDFLLPIFLGLTAFLMMIYSYINSIIFGEGKTSWFLFSVAIVDIAISSIVFWVLSIWFVKLYGLIGVPMALSIAILLKIILNLFWLVRMRRQTICSN